LEELVGEAGMKQVRSFREELTAIGTRGRAGEMERAGDGGRTEIYMCTLYLFTCHQSSLVGRSLVMLKWIKKHACPEVQNE
jgi:hypothetical protein